MRPRRAASAQSPGQSILLPLAFSIISSCCSTIHQNKAERSPLRSMVFRIAFVSRFCLAMRRMLPHENANGLT